MASADSAEADELFTTAAAKYQLLVHAGIRNSELYRNLGNLQSHEVGQAIANYERARRLDPNNRQLLANLEFAKSRVQSSTAEPTVSKAATSNSRSLTGLPAPSRCKAIPVTVKHV